MIFFCENLFVSQDGNTENLRTVPMFYFVFILGYVHTINTR